MRRLYAAWRARRARISDLDHRMCASGYEGPYGGCR